MAPSREAVMSALFADLQAATFSAVGPSGATTWASTGRRLRLWGDVDPSQQPALFLVEHMEEMVQPGRGIPRKLEQQAFVYVYARCDGGQTGGSILNTLMDAIESSIAPAPGSSDILSNAQTLGGVAYKCWVQGKVFKDPGDLDDQALLIVPIVVTVP